MNEIKKKDVYMGNGAGFALGKKIPTN